MMIYSSMAAIRIQWTRKFLTVRIIIETGESFSMKNDPVICLIFISNLVKTDFTTHIKCILIRIDQVVDNACI